MVPELDVTLNGRKELNLSKILKKLKDMGFRVENHMISYWSGTTEGYIFCGYEPLPLYVYVPQEDFYTSGEIKIKCKQLQKTLLNQVMNEELNNAIGIKNQIRDTDEADESQTTVKCRRTKERKIGYIIEKVSQWRKLYQGQSEEGIKSQRFSLEEAAQKVGISKKSLDDYLLQIRFGRKYGFNFNEHYNEKVGVLRAFVKRHKTSDGKGIALKKDIKKME